MDSCKEKCRWSDLAFCLFWVFLSGLIAHGFAYFNAAFSHDGLYQLSGTDDLFQVSLGRFLQPVWRFVRGGISAPWLTGALSLLFIALAAHLVIHLLRLRRPLWRGACLRADGGQSDRDAAQRHLYAMCRRFHALAAVVRAVGMAAGARRTAVVRAGRALSGGFAGAVSELCLGGAGVDAASVHRPGPSGPGSYPPRALFAWAGKAAAMALLGAALYWGGMQLSLRLAGTALSQGYNSIAGALDFSLSQLPCWWGAPTGASSACWRFPTPPAPARGADERSAGGAVRNRYTYSRARRARPGKLNALLAAVAVALLPFALNISFFFSKGVQHRLMIYALALVYLMAMQFEDRAGSAAGKTERARRQGRALRDRRGAERSSLFQHDLRQYGVSEKDAGGGVLRHADDARTRPRRAGRGLCAGETPVAILGEFPESPLLGEDVFAAYRQTGLDLRTPVTYGVVAKSYIRDKLGYNMRFATDEEIGAHYYDPEVQSMGVFPAAGQREDGGRLRLRARFRAGRLTGERASAIIIRIWR